MHDYEARYRQLRDTGASGWAGESQGRSLVRLADTIDRLLQQNCLPMPPARALELGCGNGGAAYHLARRGYGVIGIDISETAILWAKERFSEAGLHAEFFNGTVCNMRDMFGNDCFDLIYDGACLHCLLNHERTCCLSEVRRILHPEGTFVVSSMCGVPRQQDGPWRYDPASWTLTSQGRPYRTIKPLQALLLEISEAGFAIGDVTVAENPWWDHATVVCHYQV